MLWLSVLPPWQGHGKKLPCFSGPGCFLTTAPQTSAWAATEISSLGSDHGKSGLLGTAWLTSSLTNLNVTRLSPVAGSTLAAHLPGHCGEAAGEQAEPHPPSSLPAELEAVRRGCLLIPGYYQLLDQWGVHHPETRKHGDRREKVCAILMGECSSWWGKDVRLTFYLQLFYSQISPALLWINGIILNLRCWFAFN